jgi:glycosyltransferase involved in cell wall biosynthesis
MDKKRSGVLILNSSKIYGGTEKWSLLAAQQLKMLNFPVFYGYKHYIMREYARKAGLRSVYFPLLNDIDLFTVFYMAAFLIVNHIGVVVPTKVKEYWLGSLAASLAGRRSIVRLGLDRIIDNKWKNRLLYGRLADAILVNARKIADSLQETGFIPAEKVKVIYNGAAVENNISDFRRSRDAYANPSPFIYIYVGGLIGRKNVDGLIRCFDTLVKRKADRDLKLWILGDGDRRAGLESMAAESGLEKKVVFWGHRNDVYDLLKQADAFVLLSYNEGFPNAALEAAACGVPVILSDVAGMRELIVSGHNGILVNPENHAEIVEAMESVLTDDEFRYRLRINALESIKKDFTLEAMGGKLAVLIGEVLDGIGKKRK